MNLSKSAIIAIADAVFDKPSPIVVEAYSDFDQDPLDFKNSPQLAAYIEFQLSKQKGLAYFFVVYPDMRGEPIRRTIHINPEKVPGKKLRYTWQGWGLISVQLATPDFGLGSSINANSEKRAVKWASTNTEIPPPSSWDWFAVESHKKRLQRVLKKVA